MRREFPAKVRRAALARAAGRCECEVYVDTRLPVDIRRPRHGVSTMRCESILEPRRHTFDHTDPDAAGGGNDIDNCQVICPLCDREKTYRQDAPALAKLRQTRDSHQGTKSVKSPPMPGTKRSKWKRKMNGQVVLRKP